MIKHGWRFDCNSTAACTALTERTQRPCNNLAKWFKDDLALCPAHAKQRAKKDGLSLVH